MADRPAAPPTPHLPINLHGKRVLVTGSTRGIGREIAIALGMAGAKVAVHGRHKRARGLAVCQELSGLGVSHIHVAGNVSIQREVDQLFLDIKTAWGGLDILINNAASGHFTPLLDLDPAHWQQTLDVSLTGAFMMAKGAVPLMSGWGRIINISSLGAHRCLPNYGAMAAAKAGLEALTRQLALELRPLGIVVNALSSGLIETETKGAAAHSFAEQKETHQTKSPSARVGQPSDLTPIVSFLCSDAAQWIVGQTLLADGGYSLC